MQSGCGFRIGKGFWPSHNNKQFIEQVLRKNTKKLSPSEFFAFHEREVNRKQSDYMLTCLYDGLDTQQCNCVNNKPTRYCDTGFL